MKSNLIIQDLSARKELDRAAMSSVRGGNALAAVGGNSANGWGGGIFSPTTVVQVGPVVTNVDASSHLKLDMPTAFNFGGQSPDSDPLPALQDKTVRMSIAMAIDKQGIIDKAYDGAGEPGTSFIHEIPEQWHYDVPEEDQIPYDPEAANAMLDDAGYTKGADGIWTVGQRGGDGGGQHPLRGVGPSHVEHGGVLRVVGGRGQETVSVHRMQVDLGGAQEPSSDADRVGAK